MQGLLGEDQRRSTAFQHVGQTIQRVGRVERHIGGAGLENPQQPGKHFQAAIDTDRHPIIRADAQADQAVGDTVGLAVQLGITQLLPLEDQGNGLGLRPDLLFEQVLDANVRRVVLLALVEGFQQQGAFRERQHIQLRELELRRVDQGLGQLLQGALHQGAEALRLHRLHALHQQPEAIAVIVDCQGQRVVGPLGAFQQAHAWPLQAAVRTLVPVVEQAGEQRHARGYATATLGQGQRRLFVGQQFAEVTVGRQQQFMGTL